MCHVCLLILTFYQSYQIKCFAQMPFFWNVLNFFVCCLFVSLYISHISLSLISTRVYPCQIWAPHSRTSTFVFSISSIIIKHIPNLQFTVYSHEIKVETIYIPYIPVTVSFVLSSLFSMSGWNFCMLYCFKRCICLSNRRVSRRGVCLSRVATLSNFVCCCSCCCCWCWEAFSGRNLPD